MNKKILALKILLPFLIILLVALITLEIKCFEWHDDYENGLAAIFVFIINIIPIFAMMILGAITLIVSILLFTVKKKIPVIIVSLVILCLLIPFVVFSAYLDIMALGMYIEVPIVAVSAFVVDVVSMILCCLIIKENRKRKKELLNQ